MSLAPVGWAMPTTGVALGEGAVVGFGVPVPGEPVGLPVAAGVGLQAAVARARRSGREAASAGRAETRGREVVMARETTVELDRFPVTGRNGVDRSVWVDRLTA
jgi:hypothetical protein